MSQFQTLNDCGCCEGVSVQTPVGITNRCGLSAIAYRVGTHALFKQSMLARLSASDFPAMAELRTRDEDDFSIALLDAWATVGDILTFYQERIANESYLRTAIERRSLVGLARLIGYRLGPGVAAGTFLAFTLDDATGSVEKVTIAAGTKVQSVPGQDQSPQTFETSEEIVARVAGNGLKPTTTEGTATPEDLPALPLDPDPPDGSITILEPWFKGANLNVDTGDILLIARPADSGGFEPSLWRIKTVEVDNENDRTKLEIESRSLRADYATASTSFTEPGVWVMRVKAAPFGHNAPLRSKIPDPDNIVEGCEWPINETVGDVLTLDAVYNGIETDSFVVIDRPVTLPDYDFTDSNSCPKPVRPSSDRYRIFAKATAVQSLSRADYGITARATELRLDTAWLASGELAPVSVPNPLGLLPLLTGLRAVVVYGQPEPLERVAVPVTSPLASNPTLTLDGSIENLAADQKVAIQGKRMRARISDTATDLELISEDDPDDKKTLSPGDELIVTAPMEEIDEPVVQEKWYLKEEGGFEGAVTASEGLISFVPAAEDDDVVTELATIESVNPEDENAANSKTQITLRDALENVFDPTTVSINANVVAATHGETVEEVLGSGDASQSYQSFTLTQTPLTHVSASTPSGRESTLEVWVNDVQWKEVSTLLGSSPEDHVYVTRTDDDGITTIQFGDGQTGARLPSGQENVRAKYRKGIGLEGLVNAAQLSLLLDRPLGVKEVTNPLASSGAEDRDSLDEARENAPTTVLTLDRAVSLQDYEDFSRTFAGIAKALATFTGRGRARGIFLTVAGVGGAQLSDESITTLLDALRSAGDPYVPIEIKSYRPVLFKIAASIEVAPDHLPESVLDKVKETLERQFSFDVRRLGQHVFSSEVIAVIQSVSGVVAVDLDILHREEEPADSNSRLLAEVREIGEDGTILAAELLTLDTASLVDVEVMA